MAVYAQEYWQQGLLQTVKLEQRRQQGLKQARSTPVFAAAAGQR